MRSTQIHPWIAVAVLLAITSAGCDSRPKRVPISGKVFVDGELLTQGNVKFVPESGRAASGKIVDGTFSLTCYEKGDGALVGEHRVAVVGREVVNGEKIVWHAPRKYADFRKSGITQTVTKADDAVVINLTWKGEKRR